MMTYLEDLKNELKKRNVSQDEIDDIIRDHDEMISEALREGLTEEEIPQRFGDPKALAEELSSNTTSRDAYEESDDSQDDFKLFKSFMPSEDEQKVYIAMVYQDVTVRASNDSDYHVNYQGPGDINEYNISYHHGELKIESPKFKGLLFKRNKKDSISFIIEVPKSIELVEFKHKTVSGDIDFRDVNAKDAAFSITSGDLNLKNTKVDKLVVNTVSGDVNVKELSARVVETSQVSGDMNMSQVIITELIHAGSVSGDFSFNEAHVEVAEFNMVNGDVEGKEFYPKMISFKSVSGDLDIKNNERTDIKMQKTNTLSGKININ